MGELNSWQNFYVVMGSASGALVGLQFVIMSLISEKPVKGMGAGVAAFTSPIVFHFSAVLFLAGISTMPWETTHRLGLAWAA